MLQTTDDLDALIDVLPERFAGQPRHGRTTSSFEVVLDLAASPKLATLGRR